MLVTITIQLANSNLLYLEKIKIDGTISEELMAIEQRFEANEPFVYINEDDAGLFVPLLSIEAVRLSPYEAPAPMKPYPPQVDKVNTN